MASRQSADAAVAEKQESGYAMPKRQANHGWETAKRIMHGLVILFSIIGIALGAALLAKTAAITVRRYNEDSGLFEFIIGVTAIPILTLAAIWSIAELVTQLCKKWQSGIHPGAHVGVLLILWLGAIICTGLLGFWYTDSATWDYDFERCERYQRDSSGEYYSDEGHCPSESERSVQRSLGSATLAFLAIVGVLYFVLFAGACSDTQARNRTRAASKIHKHSLHGTN